MDPAGPAPRCTLPDKEILALALRPSSFFSLASSSLNYAFPRESHLARCSPSLSSSVSDTGSSTFFWSNAG